MRKIVAGLDIGSNSVKLVVGEIYKNKVNTLACVDLVSRGIKNGYIVNPENATEVFEEAFSKAGTMLGLPIKKVVVSLPSFNLDSFMVQASVTVPGPDHVITKRDLKKALDASIADKISPNMLKVYLTPIYYILNDVDKISNPVGMTAEKLTVKAVLGVIPKKSVKPVVECIKRIGVEVSDITVGPMADYSYLRTKETDEKIGTVINIGAANTTVSIFNKGVLTASEVLEIGGYDFDKDICYMYKIGREDALGLKRNLCLANIENAQASEMVIIKNKNDNEVRINQYDISDICMERLNEILNLCKKQINLLTKKKISYIIVTGGVTEFSDFAITLNSQFDQDAEVGQVTEIGVRNNKFVTAFGLIRYEYNEMKINNTEYSIYTLEEQEEFSGLHRKVNVTDNSVLGKLFGYFFDN
jgi:cell division protein FtsA